MILLINYYSAINGSANIENNYIYAIEVYYIGILLLITGRKSSEYFYK